MTLLLTNDDVKSVLTMGITMSALEEAYQQLARGEAVCRPRVDIQIPTQDPGSRCALVARVRGAVIHLDVC